MSMTGGAAVDAKEAAATSWLMASIKFTGTAGRDVALNGMGMMDWSAVLAAPVRFTVAAVWLLGSGTVTVVGRWGWDLVVV